MSSNLTGPQYAVLSALATHPLVDQQTLGRLASLDKSSIADVVTRLVRKAWIARSRDPLDRRRYMLSLTPAAVVALASITPIAASVQDQLLSPLGVDRHSAFVSDLATVAGALADEPSMQSNAVRALGLRAPGHLIRRAQQVHTVIWGDVVGSELTGPQYAVLYVVGREPHVNQRRLGELAALDKSSTGDIVSRLIDRGWLEREQDPGDKRGRLLRASDASLRRLRNIHASVNEVQMRLLQPICSDVRRQALTRDLALIAFRGDIPSAMP